MTSRLDRLGKAAARHPIRTIVIWVLVVIWIIVVLSIVSKTVHHLPATIVVNPPQVS